MSQQISNMDSLWLSCLGRSTGDFIDIPSKFGLRSGLRHASRIYIFLSMIVNLYIADLQTHAIMIGEKSDLRCFFLVLDLVSRRSVRTENGISNRRSARLKKIPSERKSQPVILPRNYDWQSWFRLWKRRARIGRSLLCTVRHDSTKEYCNIQKI